jgi:pimeloyl-ACP methyl ester carboxylesterase
LTIIDVGRGTPIVMIPGIQGRWEWMRPAVDALGARCRVITFSLADEPTAGWRYDPAQGFRGYVQQVADAMDAAGLEGAAVCGVSYGGLVAAAFAARWPGRVTSLVLVSALPPTWRPDARVRFFLRAPRLLTPLFMLSSLRLYREIAAATPGLVNGLLAALRQMTTALRYIFNPSRMARRVQVLRTIDLRDKTARVRVPTLVVTGEPALDRVVPVQATHEYLRMWPHAREAMLPRTGHLGLITRPDAFASIVATFVNEVDEAEHRRASSGPAEAGHDES